MESKDRTFCMVQMSGALTSLVLSSQSQKVKVTRLGLLGVWSLVNEVPVRAVGSRAPAARTAESHSPELSRTPRIWVTESLQTCDESSSLLSGTASALADLIFSVCKA